MNYDEVATEELQAYLSDYHKDVFGTRLFVADREKCIDTIKRLDACVEAFKKSNPQRMRDEGWLI